MSYISCKSCGTLLKSVEKEHGYCNECTNKHRQDFMVLRDYIKTHRNASIMDIVKETHLSLRVINACIAEEKVQLKCKACKTGV